MTEAKPPDVRVVSVGRTACPKCGHIVDVSQADAFEAVECQACGTGFAAPGRLGPYVLLKLLGQGEMGMTFKAYEKTMGRHVAVKVLRRSLCNDRTLVDSFFSEARALASLDHANVVRAFSVGEASGQPYLVMELVGGKRLDQLFTQDRPLDEYRTLEIGIGVAEALQAATGKGLIHSDIKPANILLDRHGAPKLVDFGIARFGGGRLSGNDAIGTPYYLAPEQVLRGSVDLRTDIYGLGATLFHALAGRPPFPGTDIRAVMRARLNAGAPDLWSIRHDIRTETAALVARMLQREPDRRYRDYESLLADLRGALSLCPPPAAPRQDGSARGDELTLVSQALADAPAPTKHKPASSRTKHPGAAGTSNRKDESRPVKARLAKARTPARKRPPKVRIVKEPPGRRKGPTAAKKKVDAMPWIIAGAVAVTIILVIVLAYFMRNPAWK